ncbi:hypothetical protein TWF718_003243 [Orbilia javanica]|uniref:Uncharacterized protein n=1 Tax=Orbilia javanica TaxID=47235 RepID=A0AAN8R8F3_9PEZI
MATFRISVAATSRARARPVLARSSRPSLHRSLVFFVHHRSGPQQCHIPPTSPNRSWAQSLAQMVHSARNSNWDHAAARTQSWHGSKTVRYQWIQNHKALINDWFHEAPRKTYGHFYRIRHDHWAHSTRDTARKPDPVKKSLFRALDIMSKPYVRQAIWPTQSATTVKAPVRTQTSPFGWGAHPSIIKPITSTAAVDTSPNSIFEKQREVQTPTPLRTEPPVPVENIQETTPFSATAPTTATTNPKAVSTTLETTSNLGADGLVESQGKLGQVSPEDARVLSIDETASQVTSCNVNPIGTHSKSNDKVLGSAADAVMDRDSGSQTEKNPETLQATTANMEPVVELSGSEKASKLSPADLIASLRYYDRRRGTLPDEEPLSPEDIAVLESSRTKLTKGRRPVSQSEASSKNPTKKTGFKRIGLAISSVVVGGYIFGVGTKLLSVQPESTAATELLSAVQRSKVAKARVD